LHRSVAARVDALLVQLSGASRRAASLTSLVGRQVKLWIGGIDISKRRLLLSRCGKDKKVPRRHPSSKPDALDVGHVAQESQRDRFESSTALRFA